MSKMFFATLGTETNTFSPIPTGWNAWESFLLVHSNDKNPGAMDPVAYFGPLAEKRGWQIERGLLAYATPAGMTPEPVYESLRDELISDLKAVMPVDGAMLLLHGAMVAGDYDDCEGDLLAHIRKIVGPDIPVGAVLDLHANLSDQMLQQASVLVGYKEYPHTDIYQRLEDLFYIVADAAEEKTRPVMHSFALPIIGGSYHTNQEPMQRFVREMEALEKQEAVLNVWLAHGFEYGDVPFLGVRMVAITDNDPVLAEDIAEKMGRKFYNMRKEALSMAETMESCLDKALAAPIGPVTIADTADNAGGGAPSDSTFFLREMMARKIENAGIASIWDPVAVSICEDAGLGACLPLRIGGKLGPTSGNPVDVTATVIGLAENVLQELGGSQMSMGRCAAVKIHLDPDREQDGSPENGIDVILSQHRTQPVTPNIFSELGIDPGRKKILVVKSNQHFYAAFKPISAEILYAGGMGALQSDMTTIPYKRVNTQRFWPFVDNPLTDKA
ncbi:MAG: M81 family metallopeptidase [Thermodesulfobacteriota bacterium]